MQCRETLGLWAKLLRRSVLNLGIYPLWFYSRSWHYNHKTAGNSAVHPFNFGKRALKGNAKGTSRSTAGPHQQLCLLAYLLPIVLVRVLEYHKIMQREFCLQNFHISS